MTPRPSQRLRRRLRKLQTAVRKPEQANLFFSAGLAMLGYRFFGGIFGAHPDNTFIGFALAFFGLWQGAEKNNRNGGSGGVGSGDKSNSGERRTRRRGGRPAPESEGDAPG